MAQIIRRITETLTVTIEEIVSGSAVVADAVVVTAEPETQTHRLQSAATLSHKEFRGRIVMFRPKRKPSGAGAKVLVAGRYKVTSSTEKWGGRLELCGLLGSPTAGKMNWASIADCVICD